MSWNGTQKNKGIYQLLNMGCALNTDRLCPRGQGIQCATLPEIISWATYEHLLGGKNKWGSKSISDITSGPSRWIIVCKKGVILAYNKICQYIAEWGILIKTVIISETFTDQWKKKYLGGLKFQVRTVLLCSCSQLTRSLKDKLYMSEWPTFMFKVVNQAGLK